MSHHESAADAVAAHAAGPSRPADGRVVGEKAIAERRGRVERGDNGPADAVAALRSGRACAADNAVAEERAVRHAQCGTHVAIDRTADRLRAGTGRAAAGNGLVPRE